MTQYSAVNCQACMRKNTLKRKQNGIGEDLFIQKTEGAYTHIFIV